MTSQTFISECSSSTCPDSVEKYLLGSDNPRPQEIKPADYCLLHDYPANAASLIQTAN